MALPTPEDFKAAGGDIFEYRNPQKFREDGGRTHDPLYPDAAYVVTAAPGAYARQDIPSANPFDAMLAYWELFLEGGWTVLVWDVRANKGWSYQHVGPGWEFYLEEDFKKLSKSPRKRRRVRDLLPPRR